MAFISCMQSVHTLLLFILFSHGTLMSKLRYIFYCKTQFHAVYSTLLLCKHARSTRSGLTIKWPLSLGLQSRQLQVFIQIQYVQSQSSKIAHVYFSNISCHPLIIQSRPGSSRILNQSILQDPQ